jgi:acetyl esterase/lipase
VRTVLAVVLASGLLAAEAAGAELFERTANLSYDLGTPSPDPALNRLDVYVPSGAKASRAVPIVVYVHGGSWRAGDKGNQVLDKARLFTREGYVFVSINYRLSPHPPDSGDAGRLRFPAHPSDVGEALGWLRRNARDFGGDPSRIVLVGHSAGAHLVSLVSTRPSFVRAHGVKPTAIRGTVALDTATLDLTQRADPATSDLSLAALEGLWNAFATPAENRLDGSWAAASPLLNADRRDAPHLAVVQSRPLRIVPNTELIERLELDPATNLLVVDNSHQGINRALGDPADQTGETEAVLAFAEDALAADVVPKPALERKPPKRSKLPRSMRKKRVTFGFSAADGRARFDCRIDARRWRKCSSPKSYRLGKGKHRFRVRSKNRDGRSELRSYRFRVKKR